MTVDFYSRCESIVHAANEGIEELLKFAKENAGNKFDVVCRGEDYCDRSVLFHGPITSGIWEVWLQYFWPLEIYVIKVRRNEKNIHDCKVQPFAALKEVKKFLANKCQPIEEIFNERTKK